MLPSSPKRKIYTKKGDTAKIKEYFGCNDFMVSVSLNFKRDSLMARKIRDYAINELKCMYRL